MTKGEAGAKAMNYEVVIRAVVSVELVAEVDQVGVGKILAK
jgi:hypothetical protein